MKFIILGDPIAKMRHRHKGKFAYDLQHKEKFSIKTNIIFQITQARESNEYLVQKQLKDLSEASSFSVSFEFHEQAPKSDPWGLKWSNSKADCDNYCKYFLDCCNSILYSDDHKIVALKAFKCYSPFPKTIMDIEPMQDATLLNTEQSKVLKVFQPDELISFLYDIAALSHYSPNDIEVMSRSEYEQWLVEVTEKKLKFADKWGSKLNKIASKTKVPAEGKTLC